MNTRLQRMIDRWLIPNQGGVFIDAYNQTINEEITGTILTRINDSNHYFVMEETTIKEYRIRKLTPRECFRLMGVDDTDIDKIQSAGISNSQQYKMAGNSIVVDVLYHLFRKMFVETENESEQLTLF